MTRKRHPGAALALIALIGAGCGSNTATGAASRNANGASGQAATKQEKAVKFAQCMRRNGVSEFPDPGASGNLTLDAVANGSSVNPNTPAFKQAISACKNLEPTGFTGSKRSRQQQQAGLRFAECIRANGVPDFPDPLPNGPLVDTNRIPSANQAGGMDVLNAAMHKCGGAAAAAGVTP